MDQVQRESSPSPIPGGSGAADALVSSSPKGKELNFKISC